MTEYTTEAEGSVRARRRRRSLAVIGTVLLLLFFAFWYALSYYQAESAARAVRAPGPTCAPYDPNAVTPEKTQVNVYNATDRNGLAAAVSKTLEARGFVIGKVANDPSKRKAPAVAEVRHGPATEAQARLVLSALPEGATTFNDKRKSTAVDLALGEKFTTIVPVPTDSGLPMCPAPTESP